MSNLLTVDELKGYIADTSEDDATLQQRIDDTETELDRRFGRLALDGTELAEVTETIYAPGRTLLPLSQQPDEIVEVTDTYGTTDQALESDAYRIRGTYLARIAGSWGTYTTVTYRPSDARAARRRVIVKLVQLDMNYAPGFGGQSGGPWSENYFGKSYDAEREAIMSTLGEGELFA